MGHGSSRPLGSRRLPHILATRNQFSVLATTSELGTPIENAGVNGLPSTSNLMGSNTLNDESTPGIRVDFGKWLPGTDAALGARFYSMFDAGSTHSFDEGIVTRPFFNVDAGEAQSLPINYW